MMESLAANRKKIKKQSYQKVVITCTLLVSISFGTSALASSDEIRDGMRAFARSITTLLISEVEREISIEGDYYANAISEHVATSKQSISKELSAFKESELLRAQNELTAYYEEQVSEINKATFEEIETEKELIENLTDSTIEKGIAAIDQKLKKIGTESPSEHPDTRVPKTNPSIELEPPAEPIESNLNK
ncbi:MAG: hypothetical protein ACE3JQ_12580 [Paenisporosarcina sp.]